MYFENTSTDIDFFPVSLFIVSLPITKLLGSLVIIVKLFIFELRMVA